MKLAAFPGVKRTLAVTVSVLAAAGVATSAQAQQVSFLATGLDAPRGMTLVRTATCTSRKPAVGGPTRRACPTGLVYGPDGALYISDFGAAPAGLGRILLVTIED